MTKLSCELPEHAAQLLGDADHFVGRAFDLDRFADRIDAGEEAVSQIVADEGHGGVAAGLFPGDAAAGFHLDVVDGGDVFGDALDVDARRSDSPL